MGIVKFPYKKYGEDILRPVIPVEIIHGGVAVPYEVLIDSGADFCIFDSQIAEIFDVDVLAGELKEVWGLTGGGGLYYPHKIVIGIGGRSYETEVGFFPGMGRFGFGIVGQKGFFDIFAIKFDLLKEEIELKEYKKKKQ